MSKGYIEVNLYNTQMEYLRSINMPVGTVPMPNTKFNINISKFGIYKNTQYLVHDVITEYVDTDDSDGYGNYGETKVTIKLIVTVMFFETNKPKDPEPVAPAKKRRATK